MKKRRCEWCGNDPLYVAYHDTEWGVPVYDDAVLFEFLILETFQAGLSWITILRKRENFRNAFDHFDHKKIAAYKQNKIEILLGLWRQPEKFVETAISIFLRRRDPHQNVQVFHESQHLFAVFTHEAVEVRKVTE